VKEPVAASHSEHSGFIVIGKTRTLIWGQKKLLSQKPHALYDPYSRPRSKNQSHAQTTSNYDCRDYSASSQLHFRVLSGWMRPHLDERYCELIASRIANFDHIYLLGGGLGKWSGINNFMKYTDQHNAFLAKKIEYRRYMRLTDFPDHLAKRIFEEMLLEEGER